MTRPWSPRSELLGDAARLGVPMVVLEPPQAKQVRAAVDAKFRRPKPPGGRLFERLRDCSSTRDPDAWKLIAELAEGASVFLFLETGVDDTVYVVPTGWQASALCGEAGWKFTIYVTDPALDYLVACTVEDSFVAAGTAADWLDRRLGYC